MTINLQGKWNLSSKDGKYKDIALTLPGDIHSSLLEAGIIKDPYYAKNEEEIQWVGKTDWKIERVINLKESALKGKQFLTLESADTFVRVFVNGKEVGFCDNYFCAWRFDITDALVTGDNLIALEFESAEKHATELAKAHPYRVPDSPAPIYSPNRNFARKIQCHGGWDWGPCIMAAGIYGAICIEQVSNTEGFVDYIEFNAKPTSNEEKTTWHSAVTVTYTALSACKKTVCIKLTKASDENDESAKNNKNATQKSLVEICETRNFCKGENRFTIEFDVQNPERWYVVGTHPQDTDAILQNGSPTFRENTLYKIDVSCGKAKKCKKVAFRTLKVVTKEDEHGKSLFFEVNGQSIFAKGSNWIPSDALPSRQTNAKTQKLLSDLVASNQNCVRIWGGGQYETDFFYEVCDRKGILIWQDCMFACSLYPAYKEFLESVKKEIRHQVRRLQSHPSIALWCGNNELVGAFGWYAESKNVRDRYLIDYDRLNEGVLGEAIRELDSERTWWPSSPSAGPNDFSDNWHTDGRGDMHYWSVWHERKAFEAYYEITPRFVSEFGYQSFPSLESVKTYAPVDEQNLTSPVMEHHQKNLQGNTIIIENFARYFRFPNGFDNMLYLSQVQQALAIKTAVDYWRSLRPICMGSLVWQLNDVWPVASWSSIEYSGKWKLLHYAEKNFFAPVYLSLFKKDGMVHCVAINDTQKDITSPVCIRQIDVDGNAKTCINIDVCAKAESATEVFVKKVDDFDKNCILLGNWSKSPEVTLFLQTPKSYNFAKANINVNVSQIDNVSNVTNASKFAITLKADKLAVFVTLDVPGIRGTFSDNAFTLAKDEERTITFCTEDFVTEKGIAKKAQIVNLARFKKALSVKTLRDTY